MSQEEGPWTIVGTLAAIAVLALSVYAGWIEPRRRRNKRLKELAKPARLYFQIRDGLRTHNIQELVLPANSEMRIGVLIEPTTHFHSKRTLFGCLGERDLKPFAFAFDNEFVIAGSARYASPETNPNHNLLLNRHYQMAEDRAWLTTNPIAWGFRIKTVAPGTYPARIVFHGEEVEGVAEASIRVVENPSRYVYMRCVNPEHPNCIVQLSSIREFGDLFK